VHKQVREKIACSHLSKNIDENNMHPILPPDLGCPT